MKNFANSVLSSALFVTNAMNNMRKRNLFSRHLLLPALCGLVAFSAGAQCVTQGNNANLPKVFNYTGGVQNYTVPVGCTSIVVTADGGMGGNAGGLGGRVVCTLTVVPNTVLAVYVGGNGNSNSGASGGAAVFGLCNGGAGGAGAPAVSCAITSAGAQNGGGGGGGASGIKVGSTTLLVAAGGGGSNGAGNAGGQGGAATGQSGTAAGGAGGTGGTPTAGGTGNATGNQTNGGGGGAGSAGGCVFGFAIAGGAGGGGGGGGWWGGGGGVSGSAAGAGGGGSNLATVGLSATGATVSAVSVAGGTRGVSSVGVVSICPQFADNPVLGVATSTTCNSITIPWTCGTYNDNIEVAIGTDPTFTTFSVRPAALINSAATSLTQTVPSTPGGVTYYYRVRGYNSCANVYSSGVTGSVTTINTLPATTLAATTSVFCNSMTLNWNAGGGLTSSYSVDVSTNAAFTTHLPGYPLNVGNVLSRNVTGLTTGTLYYYRVAAVDVCGNVSTYVSSSQTTLNTLPPPSLSATTNLTCNSVSLNWAAVGVLASSYEVEVATDAGFTADVTGYPLNVGNVLTRSVTGLTTGTLYYYRVRAIDACGNASAWVSGTVTTLNTLAAPSLAATTNITCNSMTVNWTNNAGVLTTSYEVDVATDAAFTIHVPGYPQNVGNVLTRNLTGLAPGITYYFRVRAKDACSNLSANASGNSTTVSGPSIPTLAATSCVTFNSITVNWNSASLATSYYLAVATDVAFTNPVDLYPQNVGNVLTKTVTGLLPGVTYYYRVAGVDVCGNLSSFSSTGNSATIATPSAPTALSISGTTETTANANFTAPGIAPTGYIVVASVGALVGAPVNGVTGITLGTAVGSNGIIRGTGTTPAAAAAVSGLTANTAYTLSVFSYNTASCSAGNIFGTPVSGFVTTCPPAATFSAGSATSNSITLSGIAASAGGNAVPYTYLLDVYKEATGTTHADEYPSAISFTPVAGSYTVNFLAVGTTYWFKITVIGACNTSSVLVSGTTSLGACTVTGNYVTASNSPQNITGLFPGNIIPTGVTSIHAILNGGKGANGSNGNAPGGLGGKVECDYTVVPGQSIFVYVGGAGRGTGNNEGFGGSQGGDGGQGGGDDGAAGAGSSDIRIGANTLAGRVLVAAGGGGGGGGNVNAFGGAGGGAIGGTGGGGGTQGQGGTQGAGGGGFSTGTQAAGGTGQDGGAILNQDGGGGGGGGYWSGGGGGRARGGGGGGSNFVGAGATGAITNSQGAGPSGDGNVTISYVTPGVAVQTMTGSNATFCAGSVPAPTTLGLAAAENGVTYQLLANGVSVATKVAAGTGAFVFTAVPAPSTTTVYSVVGGSGCTLNGMTGSVTITVNSLPTSIAANATTPGCVGQSISLTSTITGGSGYTLAWTGNTTGISSATSANTTIPSATAGNTGIFTLTATAAGCAGSTVGSTSSVVINQLPTSISPAATSPVCVGNTITLTGNVTGGSGYNLSWTGSTTGIASSTSANTTIPAAVLANDGVMTLTATAPGCAGSRLGSANVVVNQLPTSIAPTVGPSPVCAGTSVTLTGNVTGGTGYTLLWTGNTTGITSTTSANTSIPLTIAGNSGTFTLTASAAGCAGTTAGTTTALAVNQLPTSVSPTAGPSPACVNGTITLTGNVVGGNGYVLAWTGNTTNIISASSDNTTISPVVLGNEGAFTLTATAPACAGSRTGTTSTVIVNQLPTSITPTATNPVCVGTTITLTGNIVGGDNYTLLWTGAIAGIGSTTLANTSIASAAVANNGLATLTATAAGCAGNTNGSVLLVTNLVPTAIGDNLPLCVGGATVTFTNVTGGTWSSANLSVATVNSSTGEVFAAGTPGTSVITYSNGVSPSCSANTTATVNPTPAAITGNPTLCLGGASVALGETATGGTWSSSDVSMATVHLTNGTLTATTNPGNPVITFSNGEGAGCSVAVTASVNATPSAITNNLPLCIGGDAIVLGQTAGGGTWSSNDVAVATVHATNGTMVAATNAGNATITYSNGAGAGCSVSTTATVNPTPAAITGNPTLCLGGDAVTLGETATGGTWSSSDVTMATVHLTNGTLNAVTNAGNPVITFTNGEGAGCSVSITASVNPTPAAITGNPTLCIGGDPVTLGETATGGTWSSSDVAMATVHATNGTLSPTTNAGNPLITYSNGEGAGCSVQLTATVNPTPTAISGNPTLCLGGDPVTLGETATGGTWSSDDVTMATVDLTNGALSPASTAGHPVITFSNGEGAGCSVSITASVNPTPAAITGNPTLCIGGDPVTLGETATGGTWSSSDVTMVTVHATNGTLAPTTNAGSPLITYSNGEGGGCSVSLTATVNPTPTAITGNPTLCLGGDPVSLGETATGGTWRSSDVSMATVHMTSGTLSPTTNPGNPVITFSNGEGAACSVVITATVNTTPAAITGNPTLCIGGDPVVLGETATGGTWSSTDASMATVHLTNGTLSPATTAGNPVITYSNGEGAGCSVSLTATVNPTPTAITGNPTLCLGGDPVSLGETATGGTWSSNDVSMATVHLTNGTLSPATTAGNPVITFSNGEGPGCSVAITATVNTTPAAITGNPTLCIGGDPVVLGQTETGGTWSSSDVNMATVDLTNGTVTPTINAGNPLITYSNGAGAGCSVVRTATVNTTPGAIGGNQPLCVAGTSITLTNVGTGGTWSSSDGTVTIGQYTGVMAPVSAPGSPVITYSNGAGAACATTATGTVNIAPAPITGNAPVCGPGMTVNLGQTSTGGYWSSSNTSVATVHPSTGVVTSVGLSGTSTVSYNSGAGAGCVQSVNFVVNPRPIPTFTTFPGGITCVGSNVTYTTQPGRSSYVWNVPGTAGVHYNVINGGLSSSDNSVVIQWISLGSKNVTVSYSDPVTFCTPVAPASNTTNVSALPAAVVVTDADVPSGGPHCGSTTLLANNGNDGIIYFQGQTNNGLSTTTPSVSEIVSNSGVTAVTRTYYFRARSALGCWGNQGSLTVTLNPNPVQQTVTMSNGGVYCTGGGGVIVSIANSQVGVNYQLYVDGNPTGAPLAGNNGPRDFTGLQPAGTYSVMATYSTSPFCSGAMANSVVVTEAPIPTAYALTGGGGYCAGNPGVNNIVLTNSQVGVTYRLLVGTAQVGSDVAGTGSAIDFAVAQGVTGYTTPGNYTVVGNPTSACATTMTGVAAVTMNPAPSVFTFSGTNTICGGDPGVTMYLSGSESGVNYQLYRDGVALGGPKPGTGFMLTFTGLTTAGTYSVLAQHGTSLCEKAMTGTAVLTVLAQPTAYVVSGTGSYCQGGTGVDILLSGTQTNVDYSLYRDGVPTGTVFSGDGNPHTFAGQMAAGVYTVRAVNTLTSCTNTMSGSATVTINALPSVYSVTGGGSYCQGTTASIPMGMGFSSTGASYTLYSPAGIADGPLTGTGGAFSFANQSTLGSYTVVATSAVGGCTVNMNGHPAVIENTLPTQFNLSSGGSYCTNGTGVELTLDGSQGGTTYRLYRGATATGTPVNGTGSAISLGMQTTAANNYIVVATSTSTLCTNTMTGVATVTVTPLPTAYLVSGTGSACASAGGVAVSIANTQSGVSYELYRNGVATGTIINGNGAGQSFGNQLVSGNYTVVATNTLTLCTNTMTGTATVTINPLPSDYTVTGGGTICSGGTGVNIGLAGSQSGVEYILYIDGVPTGSPVGGTGFALSFGTHNTNGLYTVGARNTTTNCTFTMTTSVNVTANAVPVAQSMTGGGSYCPGGAGLPVGLNNSETGVSYALYLDGNPTGLIQVGSTGNPVSFGLQTATGIYTVGATSGAGCTNTMTGSKTISLYALPTVYNITGGGGYCPSGSGVTIGLSGSEIGATYQLVLDGSDVSGAVLNGTGAALSYGLQLATGAYTVRATNGNGCSRMMNNTAPVSIYDLPIAYTLSGSGSYCAGGTGIAMMLSGSQLGVNYQLFLGGSPLGTVVGGSGFALALGNQTAQGNYTMSAINTTTGCVNAMNGIATVTVNNLPMAYAVSGGGSYCQGGTGVDVILTNTEANVNYTLLRDGITTGVVYNSVSTGAHSFTGQTLAGNYTVSAQNAITGCTNTMSGSATVSINSLPVQYAVTGGGSYCVGGTGVLIGVNSTNTGIAYQLRNGSGNVGLPLAGTGAPISFGLQTATGTYSVTATNTITGCVNDMANTVVVNTNPLPTQFTVGATNGGLYCQGGTGVHVTLSGSQSGVDYQLYSGSTPVGATIAGTGAALDFGLQTVGTYSVSATNATTTCVNGMTGGAVVATTPLPTAYNVTGTGGYCSGGTGVAVGLENSENSFQYQLYRGATLIATQTGTGAAISFGNQTTAGTYTVLATNNVTGCQKVMSGNATVTVNPLPLVHAMNGGGAYCATGTGVHVGMSTTTIGISYQLYNTSGAAGSPMTGTGGSIDFGLQTTAGSYTVVATNTSTGCTNMMSGNSVVTINAQPVLYNMTGGGGYCQGGAGVPVGLSGSELGLTYQLFIDGVASGTAAAGTGAALNFGIRTIAGTYTIVANNGATGCSRDMSGTAVIVVNPLPVLHTMTGGGSYCTGGSGVAVGVNNSTTGVNYQLYNGSVAQGAAVAGTGSAIEFGPIAAAGTYTVLATDATTGCVRKMNGSATVSINPLPVVYAVSGGGAYCQGGVGVHVGMANTESGMSYQLYHNGSPSGTAITGSGTSIDFGLRTAAGTYTIKATNPSTTCVNDMSGSAIITINSLPVVRTVTGGGAYCQGGTGIAIGLDNTSSNTSYQLYNGSTATATASGTGSPVSFGLQTAAGTYTVQATDLGTGCQVGMNGSAVVSINPLPTVYNVTGGGSYCQGGTGVAVGISGSQIGISYQLYNAGGAVGTLTPGTGSAINFGLQTAAGVYSVTATNMPTTCASNMSGNATVTINLPPTVYTVTGGGVNCAGAGGVVVSLSNSQTGVSYQLYRGSTVVGAPVAGTGSGISFGNQTISGTYSVSATNTSTMCYSDMSGGATVTINALPLVQSVTGGGSLCQGGTGVNIGLNTTESGVQYELYRGATLVSTGAGTGGAISFTPQTIAGTYTVLARNTTTLCTQNMLGSAVVNVNVLPTAYSVTGGTASYCAGGAGVAIGLANSESGVTYQLYRNGAATGLPVAGTGSGAITFGNQLSAGTYTVTAINTTTGCRAPMTGSSTISIDPLPNVYTVIGGGSYCQGSAGVNVSLGGNQTGITYVLLQNGNPILTLPGGGPIDFGPQSAGTYTIRGVSGASCISMMSGTAVVVENALPTVFDVTGGGAYCQGGVGMPVGLSGSETGKTYQLLANGVPSGAPMAGTGFGLNFGLKVAAATYSVRATNTTTGCSVMMNLTPTITIKTLPTVYVVTGGGSYCQGTGGVNIGVSSSELNVTYDLYNGATLIISQPGTTTAIDFGAQPAGSYTVKATNLGSCVSNMTGIATVSENVLPTAYAMTGGGSYCQGTGGVPVGVANSQVGVSYQLYNAGGTSGAPVAGTGGAISFVNQTTAGTYTVVAANTTTGCAQQMSTTVSVFINTPPTVFNVTGGGSYCQGTGGLVIGLSNTETGVSYQLYNNTNPVGAAQAGTNNPISFGAQAAGNYHVVAMNTTTGCVSNMNGTSVVSMNALPTVYNIGSSASSYCAGGNGVSIALSGSQTGVSYQLQVAGSPTGAPLAGTGSNLSFGMHMAPGLYTVVATNNISACSVNMATPVTIGINPLPVALPVSGGGSYCQGGTGVHIGMSASEPGIRYDLYLGSVPKATAIGNGGALDFGLQTSAGTYQVVATNASTTCTRMMTGTAVVSTNTLPAVFNMDGGGSYCQGGTGMEVKLTGSQTGVNYQLYNGGVATGTPVAGTGNPMSFGLRTAAGAYTVIATNNTTGCVANMSGVATVNMNVSPTVYTITGGGGYCSGGTGVPVGLGSSQTGVSYQLMNGSTSTGTPIAGTGSPVSFGSQTVAGTYKIVATTTGTGCTSDMSGTAVVIVNSLPNVYNVTGGGSYCSGNPAPHVGLSSSQAGMKYQLYRGSTAVGTPVTSAGGAMDFGAQATPGVYSVYATNPTTTCNANMNGSATVIMNSTVTPSVSVLVSPNDTVCAGTNVMYTALATNGGTTPAFEWKVNGFSVAIVSNYNYIPTDGDVVSVTMTSSAVCATPTTVTAQVTMTVKPNVTPQVAVTKNTADTICKGTVVTYTANPLNGGSTPGYQWLLNGSNMPSTASSWMYAPAAGDIVSVMMTSNELCISTNTAFSNPVTLVVEEVDTPVVTITADPGNHIAKGTSVTLAAAVAGSGNQPTYQWYINGSVVPGATRSTFTSSGFDHLDSVACEVTNNSACGMRTSSSSVIIYIEGGVSVANAGGNASDIRLMPNPNRGTFTVKGTLGLQASEEVTYEVTNMLGQVVYTTKAVAKNGEVDQQILLPNVANGMYMLTLKTTTGNKVFHVVVEQ